MKRFLLVCALVAGSFSAHATLIDNSHISVAGSLCTRCTSFPPDAFPPGNTIDDNQATFWHGQNDLFIGETNYLAYNFNKLYKIDQIDFYNNFTDQYNLGELEIQLSFDSTDGLDGSWSTIEMVSGDFGLDDFSISADFGSTSWVRLWMEYQGRGAHGGSPAFYLSEIDFHGTAVPEPTTLALFGLALAGLGFARKRLH